MDTLNKNIVNKPDRPIKIIQIGEGNFLRGFCDYFIHVLNNETDFNGNIAMVQPRDTHKIWRFNNQDCLYTAITEGIENGELVSCSDVIDCIGSVIDSYVDYQGFLDLAKNPDTKVILSNTTESGIYFDETDTDLSTTPTSFPAKLLALLKTRYDEFNGSHDSGFYIVPTELISHNGNKLKEILEKLAKINNLDDDFINWMLNSNKFYNTLVDRIVPGFPQDNIKDWEKKWGYIDNLAVKGEIYHLWCLEGDKSLFDVLPFDKTNLDIILCDDITPYKERKVKILNGSHTFLCPIAYLAGFRFVNKTVTDEKMKQLLNNFLNTEVMPSIVNLDEQEKIEFKDDVLARFANPTIQHEWKSIMLNSMIKYKSRVLPVIDFHEGLCKYSLFGLAALLHLYKLNVEQKNTLFGDDQEFLDLYTELFTSNISNKDIVNKIMDLEHWGYNFSEDDKNFVCEAFDLISNKGIEEAIKWVESL